VRNAITKRHANNARRMPEGFAAGGRIPLSDRTLQVGDEGAAAHRVVDLQHGDQLPAVLPERVQDLAGVVLEERRHEVLPLLHGYDASRSSRRFVTRMHTPITTSMPPSCAMRHASSFTIPSCSHSSRAPIFTAFYAISGV